MRFSIRRLLTFRAKLVLAISLVGVLFGGFDVYNEMTLTRRFVSDREITRIKSVGELFAETVIDNLLDNNPGAILEDIDLLARENHVRFICVTNTKNIVIISSLRTMLGKQYIPKTAQTNLTDRTGSFVKSFPLQRMNKPFLGYLHYGYSLKTSQKDIRRALFRTSREDLLLLFATILIAWFVSGILLRPLTQMQSVAKKIAQGDFSEHISAHSDDIIGRLAETLNDMAYQLGDLTENLQNRINEKTAELEASNKKLLELDQLKSGFVSMVSHELRTPLTSIIGFSRTMLNLNLPEDKKTECLRIIESEGKRLARMVEEFLDISKIEAGHFALNQSSFNIADVIRESAALIEKQISCRITLDIRQSIPDIIGDKDRLRMVILNLLDNAAKHTRPGETITVSETETGSDITISISDQGCGIPKADQEKIFNKFYRGKDDAEKTRGSGLGLFIARKIIEAHNGTIRVESEPGKGATFLFTLPRTNSGESGRA